VHQMMSKWQDCAVQTAAFHMQCDHYKKIKPPTFFDHPEFLGMNLSRDRERRSNVKSIIRTTDDDTLGEIPQTPILSLSTASETSSSFDDNPTINERRRHDTGGATARLTGEAKMDGGWGLLFESGTWNSPEDSWSRGTTPSLFLQELGHLTSLTVAVAFCTLRNDVEGSESPLDIYKSGPWPEADPDKMAAKDLHKFSPRYKVIKNIRYWLGMDRTPQARTQYNAARPMPVLGGVSDGEIRMLQRARGPSAKTTLAWMWLNEFIAREHLAGSTGRVGPPIISRLFQFLSDGMTFYNHARKIMYTPFPFPHAQISAVFVLIVIVAVPFMMEQYSDGAVIGSLLTFATVVCLAGLHEVSRELENPFRNVPNDIPLCTLLAMFNESLITMCSGYHPDFYWHEDNYGGVGANELNKSKSVKELEDIVTDQAKEITELRELIEEKLLGNGRSDGLIEQKSA